MRERVRNGSVCRGKRHTVLAMLWGPTGPEEAVGKWLVGYTWGDGNEETTDSTQRYLYERVKGRAESL